MGESTYEFTLDKQFTLSVTKLKVPAPAGE